MTGPGQELVSVIVPAWNAERHIGRTLQSIMRQSYRHIEIIVVDDGSTDGTCAIAEGFACQDSRFRILKQTNQGPAAARNLGVAASRGTFVAPCDSDDLWHPQKIARQVAAMRAASSEVGLVYGWSVGIDEDDRIVCPDWARNTATGDVLHAMIEDNLPGSGSNALMRRNLLEVVGGYPEELRYGDDWQLHIAIAAISRCAVIPVALVGYRLRSDSITSNIPEVAADLASTTAWIRRTLPGVSETVLQRRASMVNAYLAFLLARKHQFASALRHRLAAWRNQPHRLLGVEPVGFALLLLGEALGVQRYYYRFWRSPQKWMELVTYDELGQCG